MTCSDPNTFYFSQIFDFTDTSGNFFMGDLSEPVRRWR